MNDFWTTFRKNFLQFHRGLTLFVLGFAGIGYYLWHFNDHDHASQVMKPMALYGGLFMLVMGVPVIALRYWIIRRARQPKV